MPARLASCHILYGFLRFTFKNGEVHDFNRAAKIHKAKVVLKGRAVAADTPQIRPISLS